MFVIKNHLYYTYTSLNFIVELEMNAQLQALKYMELLMCSK